jgi:hypothetical protein
MAKHKETLANGTVPEVPTAGIHSGLNAFSEKESDATIVIKLTALEHEALIECMQVDISGLEDVTPADNPIHRAAKNKLVLDLSTAAKREYASLIACGLEFVVEGDDFWSKTKPRRNACAQLAAKINDAIASMAGNESRVSEGGPLTSAPEDRVIPAASDEVMTPEVPAPVAAGVEVMTETEEMVTELEEYLTTYVKLDPVYPLPLALFICLTHCWFECFTVVPQVVVTGATSQCGKSALLNSMSFASARPELLSSDTSCPSLFRIITKLHPTIFLDEVEKLNSEKSEYRALLNNGYRKGQTTTKVINNVLVRFEKFCPKVFALIGDVYDSLRDRSIIVMMCRGEAPAEFEFDVVQGVGTEIAPRIHNLIKPRLGIIKETYADYSRKYNALRFLNSRDREIWKALFTLCQILCPERIAELEHAAAVIAAYKTHDFRRISPKAEKDADQAIDSERLVKDMELVMRDSKGTASADLIPALRQLPTGGWSNYGRTGGITDDTAGYMVVSDLLSRFGVSSRTIRVGKKGTASDTLQGYKYEDVLAAMRQHGIEPHSSPDHPIVPEPETPPRSFL